MRKHLDRINAIGIAPKPWTDFTRPGIYQDPVELATLCAWMEHLAIQSYLEIGTAAGGNMLLFEMMGVKGWGVDILAPSMGNAHRVCIGRSTDSHAIEWAQEHGPYDMVFIDCVHTYKAVKADFENYAPLAEKLVVFHDLCHEGVRKYWGELPGDKLEFYRTIGIGVMFQ